MSPRVDNGRRGKTKPSKECAECKGWQKLYQQEQQRVAELIKLNAEQLRRLCIAEIEKSAVESIDTSWREHQTKTNGESLGTASNSSKIVPFEQRNIHTTMYSKK